MVCAQEPEHGQPEDSDQEQEPGQDLGVGQEEKSGKVDRNWQDQEPGISQADQQE